MNTAPDRQDAVSRLSAVDTSQLPPDGGEHYNRLIFEKSPYLLQHAANPVDWYPWGEEAFDLARREDLPVLVSIGYSTCHWCHVMEQESFEDPEVGAALRKNVVAIKVDREERPDVDGTYMTACRLMTGSGGWPLNVFLTPDKKPFFAATYLPRHQRGELAGIIDILERIGAMWRNNRQQLLETGDKVTASLTRLEGPETGGVEEVANDDLLRKSYQQFLETFDKDRGGFGEAPRFPMPHNLSLLLRLWHRFDEENAKAMATRTLQHIRLGGVYDHVGFGVHRYAVDSYWRVPHFEKMLYDQALLTLAALDAFQATGDGFFSTMADEIMEYVVRDLAHPDGGFCSGEDADSEGAEGTFYLWSPNQVQEVLGLEHGTIFNQCYEIYEEGNFEGKNIPRLEMDLNEWAAWFGVEPARLGEVLALGRQKLFAARRKRVRPQRDDKVLTSWNGLMIAALARGGAVLGHPEYVGHAATAADFILDSMRSAEGRLLRRYRQGEAAVPAFLEDYAFFCWGLIELYQAGFENRFLQAALELTGQMERLFGDGQGHLFDTADDAETVLVRRRTIHDGALPAGNSAAALNLLRLAVLTGDKNMADRGEAVLKQSLGQADRNPTGCSLLLTALDYSLGPHQVVVVAEGDNREETEAMLQALRRRFLPSTLVLLAGPDHAGLADLSPLAKGKTSSGGHTTAYLCSGRTCQAPTRSVDELVSQLEKE